MRHSPGSQGAHSACAEAMAHEADCPPCCFPEGEEPSRQLPFVINGAAELFVMGKGDVEVFPGIGAGLLRPLNGQVRRLQRAGPAPPRR